MPETETAHVGGEVVMSPGHAAAVHAPAPLETAKSPCISSHSSDSESSSGAEEPLPCSSEPSRRRQVSQPQASRPCYFYNAPCYPYNAPVPVSSGATIHKVPVPLRTINPGFAAPIAVAIGPYHHGSPHLQEMEEAKQVARDEFCRVAGQPPKAIQQKIASLTAHTRRCYNGCHLCVRMDDHRFAEVMFTDGCFLLQFMACMCPAAGNLDAPPAADGLWAKVHSRVDAIARDVMLLENQLPWLVLQALMECAPGVPWLETVTKFLDLMACAFTLGNEVSTTTQKPDADFRPPPPHLLGLFHRRQVGAARTQSLHVPRLSSLSSTAVELAEMGVNITASKARVFGDMTMTKRRHRLGLFGELSLAPVVLSDLTACWLFNMVALEACLGATCADNFAVSSYVSAVSLLMNRAEDVQELRGKGVVVSALSDETTLSSFKKLTAHVRVGYRYYDVFQRLQEYRQERWVWIAVHGFLYRNLKTIIAVISAIGVLAGLFKAILYLKNPQQG
ncbi:hypothetical protein U9M48_041655 [Paspalum notatum var. saurae]|uniref:Uncharacterized protein n=1 Tax=Paspalum notatum var. saurae TaxID=547442 RepID=A0AAQ3UPI2_PASNO